MMDEANVGEEREDMDDALLAASLKPKEKNRKLVASPSKSKKSVTSPSKTKMALKPRTHHGESSHSAPPNLDDVSVIGTE